MIGEHYTEKGMGWVPQLPDHRDTVFRAEAAAYPDAFTNILQMPPVLDQGQLGSCVGHGVAEALEYDRMRQGLESFPLSRLFIYYMARLSEGTQSVDAGCAIRDAIKAVNSSGAPHEALWGYDISQFAEAPPPEAITDAMRHLAVQYEAVPQDEASIKSCLASGFPIVLGLTLYDSFMSSTVARTGVVPMPAPSESVIGGHCVVLFGYDPLDYFFRNSWGEGWGSGGNFTLPKEYVHNPNLCSDLWKISLVS